ncbi:hypothetical protein [Streptomyces sp. bgisy082]
MIFAPPPVPITPVPDPGLDAVRATPPVVEADTDLDDGQPA